MYINSCIQHLLLSRTNPSVKPDQGSEIEDVRTQTTSDHFKDSCQLPELLGEVLKLRDGHFKRPPDYVT